MNKLIIFICVMGSVVMAQENATVNITVDQEMVMYDDVIKDILYDGQTNFWGDKDEAQEFVSDYYDQQQTDAYEYGLQQYSDNKLEDALPDSSDNMDTNEPINEVDNISVSIATNLAEIKLQRDFYDNSGQNPFISPYTTEPLPNTAYKLPLPEWVQEEGKEYTVYDFPFLMNVLSTIKTIMQWFIHLTTMYGTWRIVQWALGGSVIS